MAKVATREIDLHRDIFVFLNSFHGVKKDFTNCVEVVEHDH